MLKFKQEFELLRIKKDYIDINNIIEAVKETFNCTQKEAIIKLKDCFKINNYSICAEFSKKGLVLPNITSYRKLDIEFKNFILKNDRYSFITCIAGLQSDGKMEQQGVVLYQREKDSRYFLSPFIRNITQCANFHNAHSIYFIGHDESELLPLGYTKIKSTDRIIIFCQDPLLAKELAVRCNDSCTVRNKVLVTSTYGSSDYIDKVNFSCFEEKDVIFIPAPTLKETSAIEKYCDYFNSADVHSLRVLPYSIVPYAINNDICEFDNLSKFELYTVNSLVELDKRDEIARLYEEINEKALDADIAINLYKDLLSEKVEEIDQTPSIGINLEELFESDFAIKQFNLGTLINSENFTLIVAPSDSGKSFYAQTLGVALSSGQDFMVFENDISKLTLNYDGENPLNIQKESFHYITKAYSVNPSQAKLTLLTKAERDCFDLTTEEGLESFEQYIVKGKYKVVIIDNFLTIFEEEDGVPKALKRFLAFSRKLQAKKVAIVLVHHTGIDKSKPFGSSNFDNLFQNVIMVYKPEKIVEFKNSLPDDIYKKYLALANEHKRFSIVTYRKIKPYDSLRDSVSILYYDKDSGCWDNYIPFEDSADVVDSEVNQASEANVKESFDPRLEALLEHAKGKVSEGQMKLASQILSSLWALQLQAKNGESFSKRLICGNDSCNSSENIIKEIFQSLQTDKIIIAEGKTSNKKYRIADAYFNSADIGE